MVNSNASNASLTPGIFKAYDIRGVLDKTLDTNIARQIGQSFGSAALEKNEKTVVIGRDGRLSGPSLSAVLAEGLQSTGVNVIDVGTRVKTIG
jgi:phosphomannomutase/phosphoglucomutase